MKVVFMGTPEFAVPTLQALIDHHQVAAVVTQPDRQRGRGKKVQFSPVKEKAAEYKIPVLQPGKARDKEFIQELETIAPDVIVVVAYGQILPERILNLPKYGCINVHGSLLPKYRGAAPIQWAVLNGEEKTGITTMYMEKGLSVLLWLQPKMPPAWNFHPEQNTFLPEKLTAGKENRTRKFSELRHIKFHLSHGFLLLKIPFLQVLCLLEFSGSKESSLSLPEKMPPSFPLSLHHRSPGKTQ